MKPASLGIAGKELLFREAMARFREHVTWGNFLKVSNAQLEIYVARKCGVELNGQNFSRIEKRGNYFVGIGAREVVITDDMIRPAFEEICSRMRKT